ncbi:hypothetical protein Tco_0771172 [Tanacetum coccineum]|uniref:Uncharacterized protein n=1 Tax=Tanacetum coccineum TaxID=301880 RepID=A0ABQ4ZFM4_9ASTR
MIQSDFFFNKDLEYLRYGRKSGRPALSISKMKAPYYPDVGLEQMVLDQMWIEEECKYDIAAVRTHMRILSVVRIEVFFLYGYDYMKKIVFRRADLKEYTIAERDFKYLDKYGSNDHRRTMRSHKFSGRPLCNILMRHWTTRSRNSRSTTRDESGFEHTVLDKERVDRTRVHVLPKQKRLKTRRIFWNLESFVGGRIREGDYRLLKRTE